MKVRIRNQIQFDEQVEQIDQRYDGKWMQKGSYCYLVFKNEENEQVVLKFHDKELTMTRFSTPKSLMRFIKGGKAVVDIPTPVGMQQFITETSHYQVQLRTRDSEQIFASYQMEISWK